MEDHMATTVHGTEWDHHAPATGVKGLVHRIVATPADPAASIARLALGLVMFPHGAQKLLGWFGGYGFSGTMGFFTGQGFPAALAALVILIEFFGSLALVFGALGRLGALGIGAIMIGAVATVHARFGFFMNWTGSAPGEGFEYHILALALAVVVLVRGSGAWSVDRALASRI
jgi:putative oxidoreductase